MPESLSQLIWFGAVGLLGVAGALVGVVYKSLDNRIDENHKEVLALDNRVRVIESSINDKLKTILEKVS